MSPPRPNLNGDDNVIHLDWLECHLYDDDNKFYATVRIFHHPILSNKIRECATNALQQYVDKINYEHYSSKMTTDAFKQFLYKVYTLGDDLTSLRKELEIAKDFKTFRSLDGGPRPFQFVNR